MIKNIVMALFAALALGLTYVTVRYGLDLSGKLPGKIFEKADAMPITKILEQGDVLNEKLKKVKDLNDIEFVKEEKNLNLEKDRFEKAKEDYDFLANQASEYEIAEANKKQEYLLDYLWIVVGNYANDNNVRFKMDTWNTKKLQEDDMQIDFDITGSYVSIINFIYDLENDKNLNFHLNEIKIAGSSSSDTTKAYFSVSGISVKTSREAISTN